LWSQPLFWLLASNFWLLYHEDCLPALLEIRGLSCSLGDRTVLRHVDLTVEEGETVALLGRSGSGKTTLLKTVNGLVAATGGEIRFEGRPLADWDAVAMRRRMGYVIQDAGLFPHWTVEANIGLVPRLEKWEPARVSQRVDALLQTVGLAPAEFRRRYPRELSGGQRQRVGIARALGADPPLLLFDEPFAALDPITRLELQQQFLELRRSVGKTSLFVTHDVREALLLATRIALLHQGRLELVATPDEFVVSTAPEARAFLACIEEPGRSS
jgi:osmoprotectant transport system ATP-binding protein